VGHRANNSAGGYTICDALSGSYTAAIPFEIVKQSNKVGNLTVTSVPTGIANGQGNKLSVQARKEPGQRRRDSLRCSAKFRTENCYDLAYDRTARYRQILNMPQVESFPVSVLELFAHIAMNFAPDGGPSGSFNALMDYLVSATARARQKLIDQR
jgi:hypothetical protein